MQGLKGIMAKLKPGQHYRLIGFKPQCGGHYRHKLLAMGFVPGTQFTALRVAPLGDPIELRIKGFFVSLRQREIDLMELETV